MKLVELVKQAHAAGIAGGMEMKSYLREQIKGDQALLDSLLDEMIERASAAVVNDWRHGQITAAKNISRTTRGIDAIAATAPTIARSILNDWLLRTSGPEDPQVLGDARKEHLKRIAADDEEKSIGFKINVIFYGLLIKRMPDGKQVREVLSDEAAMELFEQARTSATGKKAPTERFLTPSEQIESHLNYVA